MYILQRYLKFEPEETPVECLYDIGLYSKNWVFAESIDANASASSKFGGICLCLSKPVLHRILLWFLCFC